MAPVKYVMKIVAGGAAVLGTGVGEVCAVRLGAVTVDAAPTEPLCAQKTVSVAQGMLQSVVAKVVVRPMTIVAMAKTVVRTENLAVGIGVVLTMLPAAGMKDQQHAAVKPGWLVVTDTDVFAPVNPSLMLLDVNLSVSHDVILRV